MDALKTLKSAGFGIAAGAKASAKILLAPVLLASFAGLAVVAMVCTIAAKRKR
jgi:hypothetical protein